MDAVKNFVKVEVSTGYDASATEIILASGHGAELPDPTTAEYNLPWWDSSTYADPADDPKVEIIRVTGKTGDTLTITRGQEGTAASTKNTSGSTYKMILGVTAKIISDFDSDKLSKSLYDVNTILAADTDNTPTARTIAEQQIVGRITSGNIKGLSATEVRTLINVADGATANTKATGADIITGTDDAKYVTSKALKDANIQTRFAIAELYAKSLLHLDGADASTTITDTKGVLSWTAQGDAKIVTAQSKFGGASCYFDGTGDYIKASDNAVLTLGTSDFTIEMWIKRNRTGREIFISQQDSGGSTASQSFAIEFTASNYLSGIVSYGTSYIGVTGSTAVADSNWHHVALVRFNNVLYVYLDGVSQGTPTSLSGITINDSSNEIAIGRAGEYTNLLFQGWIDEFRYVVGYAVYVSAFTPLTTAFI